MILNFIPEDGLKKLEFDKLIHFISQYCVSENTKNRFEELSLSSDLQFLKTEFEKVKEWNAAKENREVLELRAVNQIDEDIFMLRKEGYVLSVEAILRINEIIQNHRKINHYFSAEKKLSYPNLHNVYSGSELDKEVYSAIDIVFDEEGEVKPNASPELGTINKMIKSKQKAIDASFNSILSSYRKQGMLSDASESYRNGRRVLSVPAENKRKIKGIIHDESTTGKTVFIEPELIISLNNDLFDLYAQRKREIYRIIKALCDELRPFSDLFIDAFEIQIEYDIIQSKSAFASYTKAVVPHFSDNPLIEIKEARHPLLHIKNGLDAEKTIPFDLVLLKNNKMLLISGPNAGGKSILMKSVGLLQIMFQAAIPVTASPDSKFGVFENICIDIGDQQSIEDDLSTYSSRLKNMKAFTEKVDGKTLMLIDEFGSGTDPKIGGAIAEALLKDFVYSGCFGVITSHYSNLKLFTYKTKGIVNGAMIFDQEKLIPTYKMKIGRPGSSFALEIAAKTGISNKIIKYAKSKIGQQSVQVEDLLTDLQREKKDLETKVDVLQKRSKELERLIKNYEKLHGELEYKRKKFSMEQKALKLADKSRENKKVEQLIREIKENQNIEKAKALSKTIKDEKKTLSTEINTLRKDVYYQKEVDISKFKKGDYIKMKTGSEIGQILKIKKDKAELSIGIMRMFVPLTELLPANEPIQVNRVKSISTAFSSNHQDVESKLDIRGFTKGEAGKIVEDFLDKVLLSNNFEVQIIHGVGNGVLKKVVWAKAKEYKDLKKIWHPQAEQGGEGITLIQL